MTQTIEGFWLTPCVYCGRVADTRDHFVPRAWRKVLLNWKQIWKDAPDIVPACRQCNSIAGAGAFKTIAEKRGYIHSRLRHKYARLLATPFHSEAELDELGPSLRSHVERREVQRLRLLLRLAWPYKLHDEVEALTLVLARESSDPQTALNAIRRREILS